MKGLLIKSLVAATLVAAVVIPAASATSSAVKLSVVPLQKAQLGSAAHSLALDSWSGSLSNADAAYRSLGPATPSALKKLGRVTGYGLDYGIDASGAAGITEVWTAVDEYKTAAGAQKALAYWKKSDPKVAVLNQGDFAVTSTAYKVPAVGNGRFGELVSYGDTNIVPLFKVDEQFVAGNYELGVLVSASTAAAAKQLAPALAKKLLARLKQELAGKLHARPAKIPAGPKAGAPAGGPDLSALALKTTDLTGTATVRGQRYFADANALSDYGVLMQPAGEFDFLAQEVEWYATANQASFEADWAIASFMAGGGTTPVDVSADGDGAQAVLYDANGGGYALTVFSSGQLAEFITVAAQSGVQASDVQNVAQSAAGYINSAGLGS